MSKLFTELQAEQEKQRKLVENQEASRSPSQKPEQRKPPSRPKLPKETTKEKVTQPSKQVSNVPSRLLSRLPTTNDIEDLSYSLRKKSKVRVNADVPRKWKELLE